MNKQLHHLFAFLLIFLVHISNPIFAQNNLTITGNVTDFQTNEPLPGASISISGTTTGTVTDFNGNYFLNINDANDSIRASFIGYQSQVVLAGNRSTINFQLRPDNQEIEEIAVIGYGVQKRSNITGAISSVDIADMQKTQSIRLDEALQGMTSGLMVTQNGGAPGAKPTIHIRGVGSINNTEPLYIVDGVQMDPGNHFDTDDIESIEVLKDAAASAIYGVKAAHGVIIINTKRGSAGKPKITFKSNFGVSNPISLPELLNSEDFVAYKTESRLNAGQNPEPSWSDWEYDTDWISAYYGGTGATQGYDFSMSQGSDKLSYYLSLGYDDEDGILIDNYFKRYSARINSDLQITDWLKIGESALLSHVNENPIDNFNENYQGAIPYRSIPIMPIYDENNPYGGWGQAPAYFQGPNPVATQYQQHETRNYNRLDGNIYASITPITGLEIRSTLAYNYASFMGEKFHEAFNYGAFANTISSLTYSTSNNQSVTSNIYATYNASISNHSFKIMSGYERYNFNTLHFNVIGNDFPTETARSMNLATGSFGTTDRRNTLTVRQVSYFGRVNYDYKEKYILEANLRRDGSSKFGPDKRWGIFPSYSIGWVVSKEDFFSSVPYIDALKIRASNGTIGSDRIGDFIYLKTYTSQFVSYAFDEFGQNKESGFFTSKFPNEEVGWEEVTMFNLGVNLNAFDNKLWLAIDYYNKDTEGLLLGVPVPPSLGLSVHNFSPVNPDINIGTMRNRGLDIEMGYKWLVHNFSINVNVNISYMKNEMQSLFEGQSITGGNGGGQIGGMTRTEAGMPISYFYGYQVQQMLNSETDVFAINTYADDGTYQEGGTGPGDFMYVDISGPDGVPDGQITAEHDRTFIGNPWPKWTYGLNLQFIYKKLVDVNFQFTGVQDVDIFNANLAYSRNFFGDNNTTTLIKEAWTPENHTQHPRNIASDPNGNFSKPSDYFIEDGSYLKLKNIQVGFNLPKKWLVSVGVPSVRIYANANNILTITKYSGIDPEIAGSNISRGVDYGIYPQIRTISGGIQVEF